MAKQPAQPESKSSAPKFTPKPVPGSSLPPQSEMASAQQSFGNSAVLNYLRAGGAGGPQMSMAPAAPAGDKYSSMTGPNMSMVGDSAPFDKLVKSLGGSDKPAVKEEVVKKVMKLKETYPSASESENSEAMVAKIKRDSDEFKKLVKNDNPDIEFKDEEHTGADRMMTPRMKEKLDRLAELVKQEWPDRKLRPTDVWDEDNEHGAPTYAVSLHYEGRAADLTVTDDQPEAPEVPKLLGRLGELAKEAGFDWVWYENKLHVHVSVKKEEPAAAPAETPAPAATPAAVPTSSLGPSPAPAEYWPLNGIQ